MKEHFEQLKTRIVNDEDKVLFEEVIGTFENGFNRACYITSWINIIESLKTKIYELSALNDSRAISAVSSIEGAEANKQSTDRIIFEQSKSCDIISATDFSTINYLWEQRCIFAHPYNQKPTKEELVYIINQSVELVLSRSISFNKEYIKEFCENIISKPHLIANDENKIIELSENTVKRIKEKLHPFYFKTLFYHYGINQNTNKENEIRKIEIIIKNLLSNSTLPFEDSNWQFESKALDYPYEFSTCIVDYSLWNKFDSRTRDILLNFYLTESVLDKIIRLSDIYKGLVSNKSMDDISKQKFFEKLDSLPFINSIYYYGDSSKQCERIINELKTWQFGQQDTVLNFINNDSGLSILSNFSSDENFELGRVLYASSRGGHWKSTDLITAIYSKRCTLSQDVYAGVVYSHFINLRGDLDFNKEKIHTAIKVLNNLDTHLIEKVYVKIFDFLEHNKPKGQFDIMSFGDTKLTSLQQRVESLSLDWKEDNRSHYELLLQKVNQYFSSDSRE